MPRWWLAIGTEDNWLTAFQNGNIWGLKGSGRPGVMWETLVPNDRILLYVRTPIAGAIGFGTIRTKFKQDKPLWPEEVRSGEVLWPLRFEFDVDYVLPKDQWKERFATTERLRTMARGGFQPIDEDVALEAVNQFEGASSPEGEVRPSSEHSRIIEALVEAGRLQKFIAEKEYPMERERLDVVWRRVEASVPTVVFEVQIGGDPYHALGKLKHAFDIWNSRIFLVAHEQDREKMKTLLAGTFHEIQSHLRFIELSQVRELVKQKRALRDLESKLGII